MTTPSASSVHAARAPRRRLAQPSVECLESRIAPALVVPIAGVLSQDFRYTDGDGDIVHVRVAGKFTSVSFQGTNGDVLDNGGDITSIVVTGAKSDFALTFADEANGSTGDGIISLGNISGPASPLAANRLPLIKGITTIGAADGSTVFTLAGYKGAGFSPMGGLLLHGDIVTGGDGISIDNVPVNTSVMIDGDIPANAVVTVLKAVAGNFSAKGDIAGNLTLGSVSATGSVLLGDFLKDIQISGAVAGRVRVGEMSVDVNSFPETSLVIGGAFGGPNASIISTSENFLNVSIAGTKAAITGGLISASQGSLNLISTGKIAGVTVVVNDDLFLDANLTLATSNFTVGNEILLGSKVNGLVSGTSFQIQGDVGDFSLGGFSKSRFNTQLDANLTFNGPVTGSEISNGGSELEVTVFGPVTSSQILGDGGLNLFVNNGTNNAVGNVTKSVISSRQLDLNLVVDGSVTGSGMSSGRQATVELTKNWSGSQLAASEKLTMELDLITGQIVSGLLTSGEDMDIIAAGISGSAIRPANDLTVIAGSFGIKNSRFDSSAGSLGPQGDTGITSAGPVSGSIFLGAFNLSANITGAVSANSLFLATEDLSFIGGNKAVAAGFSAGRNVTIDTDNAFTGAVLAGNNLTISAASLALPTTRAATGLVPGFRAGLTVGNDLNLNIAGNVVAPNIDVHGDVVDFNIAGSFKGKLYVDGDFSSGEAIDTAPSTLVGAGVLAGSLISIGGDLGTSQSAPGFSFGLDFLGTLYVGGNITADLTFSGSLNRLVVDGKFVASASNVDNIVQITVSKNVTSLVAGAVYQPTTPGVLTSGTFTNDVGGTTSGSLTITGTVKEIAPLAFAFPNNN